MSGLPQRDKTNGFYKQESPRVVASVLGKIEICKASLLSITEGGFSTWRIGTVSLGPPLLTSRGAYDEIHPTLSSLREQQLCIPAGLVKDHLSTSSAMVANGVSVLPLKILGKYKSWDYVDLTTLLSYNHAGESPAFLIISASGQILIFNPPDHQSKNWKVILDIHSWTQEYYVYVVALT